jgi:Mg2+ and Co2+ transporter CorA
MPFVPDAAPSVSVGRFVPDSPAPAPDPVNAAPKEPASNPALLPGGVDDFGNSTDATSDTTARKAGRDVVKTFAKGAVKGTLGLPGSLEEFGSSTIPKWLGYDTTKEKAPLGMRGTTVFPTPEEVGKSRLGRALSLEDIPKGYEDISKAGEFAGSLVSPSALGSAAKTAIGIPTRIGEGVKGLGRAKDVIMGTTSKGLAEDLRGAVKGTAESIAADQAKVAQEATQKMARYQAVIDQINSGGAAADLSAAQRSGKAVDTLADIKQRVLIDARGRVRKAEEEARKAGMNKAETAEHVFQAEGRVGQAEEELKKIEAQLVAKPQMDPEEFGKMVASAAQKMADEAIANRTQLSGFKQAIEAAGNEPISTENVLKEIDSTIEASGNPTVKTALQNIKAQLVTGDAPEITLQKLDSTRKFINSIIAKKDLTAVGGVQGSDAEAIRAMRNVGRSLTRKASSQFPAYRNALLKFRKLSRPLDIFRSGGLKGLINTDEFSQDLLRGEADIAGRIIDRAREGHPVFTRLMQQNPDIQNGARAFFYRELFGTGTAPAQTRLDTFLLKNQGVLRQLNLEDDFKSLASARAAGQKAVEEAQGVLSQAKNAQRAASAQEVAANKVLGTSKRLASGAEKRLGEAVGQTESLAKDAGKTAESAEKLQIEAKKIVSDIENAPLGKLTTTAKNAYTELLRKGLIDNEKYNDVIRQITVVEQQLGKTEKARSVLQRIGLSLLGASGLYALKPLLYRVTGGKE